MLGYESNLVPVVGFHSNGESVRVNFGVAPFTYEVSVAPLARREGRGGGGGYSRQPMARAVVVTIDISSRHCRQPTLSTLLTVSGWSRMPVPGFRLPDFV